MAFLCSAYKLANCSTICMKYLTLVFLAALGLDSQAALKYLYFSLSRTGFFFFFL